MPYWAILLLLFSKSKLFEWARISVPCVIELFSDTGETVPWEVVAVGTAGNWGALAVGSWGASVDVSTIGELSLLSASFA